MDKKFLVPCVLSIVLIACKPGTETKDHSGWTAYAGSKEGNRYSSNDQININNVSSLAVAWTYSSGDKDSNNRSQNQCNPIMVDGVLYGTSPKLTLLAIDAATGKLKWQFHPASVDTIANKDPYAYFKVTRGVMYWQNETGTDTRIFYTAGSKIFAINTINGQIIPGFGKRGFIDLMDHVDRETGSYNPFIVASTPGVIYKNTIIMGCRVMETADAAPGDIRAFDAISGKPVWTFHTIPRPGETGYETWPDKDAWKKLGGANNWAGMSLDEERGIVYIPTGSVGGDFYGGFRKGQNLFGNSLIALDAATGKYSWHFQVVHHDLWDRDLPANPNLVTIKKDGKQIDVAAQITKHGYIFIFDRETGRPVYPIGEKPVPTNGLPGEEPWPTQPIPSLPEPFARQDFTAADVSDRTPAVHKDLMEKFGKIRDNKMFAPPGKEGAWIFPGFDGGGEWGGAAVDIETGILYVNSSELPWSLTMIDVAQNNKSTTPKAIGQAIYEKYCLSCHGINLVGNGSSYPSLVNLEKKYDEKSLNSIVENGKNMMPGFKQINANEKKALASFLLNSPAGSLAKEPAPENPGILEEVPYVMTGYNRFLDEDGYPGIKPPWGTLNAVDLNTGKLLWKVPLGEYEVLTKQGIPKTGTENYGGPLVTKGGLIFIAATKDEKIRAFDKRTGKQVWEHALPAAGFATPATYFLNGKQYIVIACGGGKIGNRSGDTYMAFALP